VTAAVCLAFGVVNELSQVYVPTRTASLLDLLADAIGAAAGLAAFLLVGPARSE
jgi:VanZ family protein